MSYAGLEKFYGMSQALDEVYVLRLPVQGAPITKVTQVLAFAKALGKEFAAGLIAGFGRMDYDVRGVLVSGEGSTWTLDIVCTFNGETGPFTLNTFRLAPDLAAKLMVNAGLRQQFPTLAIVGADWFYMDGDDMAGEIAYWLSAPIIFDHALKEAGSTTQSFDDGKGIWYGENGVRQREWTLGQPPPIGPGLPGPGDKEKASTPWWLLAAAGAGLAYWLWQGRKI